MTRFIRHFFGAMLFGIAGIVQAADGDIGIVLMHGKWDRPPTSVLALARQLEGAGFRVATPTMPWAGPREYDVPYPQALDEIDAAVKSLRDKGARRIVVAGHSFGANAALAFAASGRKVDAIVALSPGHVPERGQFRAALAPSVAKARSMVESGAGKDKAWFEDRNQGQAKQVRASAEAYLSYFDPEGAGNMQKSAAAIASPTPLFMAVGSADTISAVAEESIFKRAPAHPKSVYTSLAADHNGLLGIVGPALVTWLRALEP